MQVILNKDIERLGKSGSIIKVKDGYARNYLIPNGLALPLTPANLKSLEEEKAKRIRQVEKVKAQAVEIAEKLQNISLTIPVLVQEEDKMYAGITSLDIAQGLKDEGFEIEKNSIDLESPIKALGIYEIPVKLHPEVSAKVKVWVVKK